MATRDRAKTLRGPARRAPAGVLARFGEALDRFNDDPTVDNFRAVQLAGRLVDETRGASSRAARRARRKA